MTRREQERQARDVELNGDAIRARCQTFYGFVKEAWKILEPWAQFIDGWHIRAICDHLEAVTNGRITRLLINVPPGSMKSLLVSVLWPAWEWGARAMRSLRYLATAFNDDPVRRDSRKCRDLIMSAWFQGLWPEVRLVRKGETSFSNRDTGSREGSAFGSLTGKRGDRLIIDDPHSTTTAESDVERDKTTRAFREGALDRLNDPRRSAIVIIMQRLHERDVSGVALTLADPFVHLRIPMRFEVESCCSTEIGWTDPRTYDGELMCPERWPPRVADALEADKMAFAWAGQYQQRPVPREGGLFKREWFADRFVKAETIPAGTRWCRHWDLAASTSETSARTAGVKIGRTPAGRFVVADVKLTRSEGHIVRGLIKTTAQTDRQSHGSNVTVSLPKDPGQAGKVQAADMIAMLAGFSAFATAESGDKTTRAEPFAAQCAAGNVDIVEAPWNEAYIDELCMFPGGAFADQVDASSGAFARLTASQMIPIVAPFIHSVPRQMPGSM